MSSTTAAPGRETLSSQPAPPAAPPVAQAPLGYAAWDVALLAICGVAWGVAYIFIREGIVFGASPLLFAAVRYALSAAAFAIIAAGRREAWPSARALAVSAAVGGLLVIGLYGGLLYWGEQYTSGGYASVLSTTAPILTVVWASALLPDERLHARALAGVLVGFAGAVVLVGPSLIGGAGGWAGPLSLVGAFACATFGTTLLRRFGGGRQGLWQIGTQFAVGGGLLGLAVLTLPVPEAFPEHEGVWAALAALVLVSSVIGYFTYFALLHRVGPVRANSVTYVIPLVGIGVGSGFFGEPITAWEIAGFLIVVTGLTLIVRGQPTVRETGRTGEPLPADPGAAGRRTP
jgi:drug/metabolite transporter (DMT)-like permease